MADRRKYERVPSSGKVIMRRETGQGEESTLPIYIRDFSDGGFSGTLFGKPGPASDALLFVESSRLGAKTAKLVWSIQTTESIHMLGFEFINFGTII